MALALRRTWPDRPYPKEDWLVMDDGVEVGQIEQNDTAAGEPRCLRGAGRSSRFCK
jgi:hypothetical protein